MDFFRQYETVRGDMNRDTERGRDPSTPEQEYSDVETEICCNSYNL